MDQTVQIVGMGIVIMLAGWIASTTLDATTRLPGTPLMVGLGGLYVGSWLWTTTGWYGGPAVVGLDILPLLFGALAVSGMLKLVSLGVAGPRR